MLKLFFMFCLVSQVWGQVVRPGGGDHPEGKVANSITEDIMLSYYKGLDSNFTKEMVKKIQVCGLGNPKSIKNIFDLHLRILLYKAASSSDINEICPVELSACLNNENSEKVLNELLKDQDFLKKYIKKEKETLDDKQINEMVEFMKSLSGHKNEKR